MMSRKLLPYVCGVINRSSTVGEELTGYNLLNELVHVTGKLCAAGCVTAAVVQTSLDLYNDTTTAVTAVVQVDKQTKNNNFFNETLFDVTDCSSNTYQLTKRYGVLFITHFILNNFLPLCNREYCWTYHG